MTQGTNIRLDQMPTPRFGVRVSRTNPAFDIGELTFKTRLITVGEDREITRINARMAQAQPLDDGLPGDLSVEQQEQNLAITGEIVVGLLQSRAEDADLENVDLDWFMANMTTLDIGPLLWFLRNGYPQPELDLNDLDEEVADPNAEG